MDEYDDEYDTDWDYNNDNRVQPMGSLGSVSLGTVLDWYESRGEISPVDGDGMMWYEKEVAWNKKSKTGI